VGRDERKPSLARGGTRRLQATHHEAGRVLAALATAIRAAVHRKREQCAAPLGQPNASPYVKDAFHSYVVEGQGGAVNPARMGTKAAAHYRLDVPAGGAYTVRLRLAAPRLDKPFDGFETVFKSRLADADEFYARITPAR